MIAGGLVFLTVLAERFFGFRSARDSGPASDSPRSASCCLPSLPHGGGDHANYSMAGMIAFESALLALGTFLVLSPQLGSHEHHGVMLGTAAGILFGVSDVAIKALTAPSATTASWVCSLPGSSPASLASVIAFYASARGLQKGDAVPVITLTSAAANVSAISGGILVFGDPMPSDPLGIVIQSFAFVLVIAAAALTPAPVRAARVQA